MKKLGVYCGFLVIFSGMVSVDASAVQQTFGAFTADSLGEVGAGEIVLKEPYFDMRVATPKGWPNPWAGEWSFKKITNLPAQCTELASKLILSQKKDVGLRIVVESEHAQLDNRADGGAGMLTLSPANYSNVGQAQCALVQPVRPNEWRPDLSGR
jgi:hypothetical protein